MAPVELLLGLATGQFDLFSVDDNYVIACIKKRRVAGLMFSLEKFSCHGSYAAKNT